MNFPLVSLNDLGVLLAINAFVLLITAELASPKFGQTLLIVKRKNLRQVAVVTMAFFFLAIILKGLLQF